MPPVGGCPLVLELAIGLMLRPPREHRLRKDVVKDLVAQAAAFLERTQNPAVRQRREHGLEVVAGTPAEIDEIVELVGDLRARGGDEVVEDPRGDILLAGVRSPIAPSRCSSTICLAPPSRSSVSRRRRSEPAALLLVPEPLHHQLQVRRLDVGPVGNLRSPPSPPWPARSAPRRPRRARARRASPRRRPSAPGQLVVALDGRTIAARAASRSSRSRRSVFRRGSGFDR